MVKYSHNQKNMPEQKLKKYAAKRDFKRTSEPSGKRRPAKMKNYFVIQKHDATNLHYDLRLQIGNVLASWAVPKGPSTDPKVKHLAIRVEDHPLAYGDFEGTIPAGEYGGGTVMVWDKGTYDNLRVAKPGDGADMEKSLRQGLIEIRLNGKKLKGGYNLIKTKGFGGAGKNSWLLLKAKDEFAHAKMEPVKHQPNSAKSGKSMKQIAKSI